MPRLTPGDPEGNEDRRENLEVGIEIVELGGFIEAYTDSTGSSCCFQFDGQGLAAASSGLEKFVFEEVAQRRQSAESSENERSKKLARQGS